MSRRAKTDATRAVAYLRCSTDRQDESPNVQRQAIAAWARAHGVEVVAEHADVGVSGATEGADRPGLVQAMASMRRASAGLLLVQRRDRLGRDVGVVAVLERAVERLGAVVVAVDMGQVAGISGMVLRGTMDLLASVERSLISERTRAALQAKRARSERVGQVPLGSRLRAGRLIPHGREGEALAVASRLRAQGRSWAAIAARLEREYPRGLGRRWHERSLSRAVGRAA